jgi:hypothetical protein
LNKSAIQYFYENIASNTYYCLVRNFYKN